MPKNDKTEPVDPDLSAEIAAEVTEKVDPPKDAPQLIPVAALTRRMRADFFNAQRSINTSMSAAMEGGEMHAAADSFEALAAMEEALRLVVIPPARGAYDRWVSHATDEDLAQLYRYYMQSFAPGEAQPSPTS